MDVVGFQVPVRAGEVENALKYKARVDHCRASAGHHTASKNVPWRQCAVFPFRDPAEAAVTHRYRSPQLVQGPRPSCCQHANTTSLMFESFDCDVDMTCVRL